MMAWKRREEEKEKKKIYIKRPRIVYKTESRQRGAVIIAALRVPPGQVLTCREEPWCFGTALTSGPDHAAIELQRKFTSSLMGSDVGTNLHIRRTDMVGRRLAPVLCLYFLVLTPRFCKLGWS